MSKIFDFLLRRKRIVMLGTSGSGKTTIQQVMLRDEDVSPDSIDRKRGGIQNNITKFSGRRYRLFDTAGDYTIYCQPFFMKMFEEAHYVIYVFDCNRYIEAKKHNKIPVHSQYNALRESGAGSKEGIKKYLEETETWLNRLVEAAKVKHKKMLIVASHLDLFKLANPGKNEFDVRMFLAQNLLEGAQIVDIEILDVTKKEDIQKMLEKLNTLKPL